jgi:hypothetical protein
MSKIIVLKIPSGTSKDLVDSYRSLKHIKLNSRTNAKEPETKTGSAYYNIMTIP